MKRAIAPEVVENLPDAIRKHVVDSMSEARVRASPGSDPDMQNEYENCGKNSEKIRDEILSMVSVEVRPVLGIRLGDFEDVNVKIGTLCKRMEYRQGLRDGFQLAKFFND